MPRFYNSNRTLNRKEEEDDQEKYELVDLPDREMNKYYKDYRCTEEENKENDKYRKDNLIKIVEGPENLMLI